MHLATHGFFLPDQLVDSAAGEFGVQADSQMVRSGLAFAGANHASKTLGSNDGLLTAVEVSSMDLHGTDLVILSACESGVGEVQSGEGVFGLRRAFALAGARHLMMSLWPVGDEITALQMNRFYKSYGQGEPPALALVMAQRESIKSLRGQTGFADPSLWAPFILQTSRLGMLATER